MKKLGKLSIALLTFVAEPKFPYSRTSIADCVNMLGNTKRYKKTGYMYRYVLSKRALAQLEKKGLITRLPSGKKFYITSETGKQWLKDNSTRVDKAVDHLEEEITYGRSKK